MAMQISPGVIRAQVVFQGKSGFPKDRYVNTFHFARRNTDIGLDGGIFSDMGSFRDEIGERLREFYLEQVATGMSVASYLSDYIKPDFEVRCYDLGTGGDGSPREAWTTTHTKPAPAGAGKLPLETAVAMSFYADRNIPRRRGRVFIGPLYTAAQATGGDLPMVAEQFATTLAQAAQRLRSEGMADQLAWSIFSPSDNEAHRVTAGWVDNDFDTIRGRGPKASVRTEWSGTV